MQKRDPFSPLLSTVPIEDCIGPMLNLSETSHGTGPFGHFGVNSQ